MRSPDTGVPGRASGVVGGWVWSENVRPFLELLSHYNGHDFDRTDWETVELGLAGTDDESPDGWYGYPLVGPDRRVDVELARAAGCCLVMVRVTGVDDPELWVRADTLVGAFSASGGGCPCR
ncbi:hypothetical protein [Streptomyces sp. NPDC026673]|uniref:hypothetical protein n=1 Tax=Streptomyces sp. NPDC026673 TaxID=3155724 RepID=UPI0033FD033C